MGSVTRAHVLLRSPERELPFNDRLLKLCRVPRLEATRLMLQHIDASHVRVEHEQSSAQTALTDLLPVQA